MNKIGIIFCAYGNPDYVQPCLDPWIKLKEKYNISIAAVHGQFKEYHDNGIEDKDYETQLKLKDLEWNKNIDCLYLQNDYNVFWPDHLNQTKYETESEIRNKGLKYLLEEKCDIIWLLDLDEFYTEEQIENIIKYINSPFLSETEGGFYAWYSINFKNYILDGKQWIDNFCPPRIFRTKISKGSKNQLNLSNFIWDNDLEYTVLNLENDWPLKNGCNRLNISYKELASKKIPKNIVQIKHLTWLHSNGKNKVLYQLKHFGHCSYKWNEEKNELEIDLDFYRKNGLDLPIIYKDDTK